MISNGAPPKVATTYLITGEYEFVRQRQRVCEKDVETKSRKPPRRPTLDLFDETMDAILGDLCQREDVRDQTWSQVQSTQPLERRTPG